MIYQISATIILLIFYGIYICKMFSQKRKGIRTDQLARGKKKRSLFLTELSVKAATFFAGLSGTVSIVWNTSAFPPGVRTAGLLLGAAGTGVFAIAVRTMRDSWRAGIPEKDKTEMITGGIYRYSRNPAFLGFDLIYISILLAFFNWALLLFSVLAAVLLHLQILQEEKFLSETFGQSYLDYKAKVHRYLGRK